MYATHLVKEKKLGKRIVEKKLEHHEIDSQTIEDVISVYTKNIAQQIQSMLSSQRKRIFLRELI